MLRSLSTPGSARTVACRRCGQRYALPGGILPACPNCGASPRALWRRLRNNAAAATVALAALGVLVAGMLTPFVAISKLGELRVFSLVGGIVELFRGGNVFLGIVLLVFSVVFPIVKLVGILVATSRLVPLSMTARKRLHHFAVLTGKYSLLDVLVIALMIVLVKFDKIADVSARPGTVLFCVAIFLSILSGLLVQLEEPGQSSAHGGAGT